MVLVARVFSTLDFADEELAANHSSGELRKMVDTTPSEQSVFKQWAAINNTCSEIIEQASLAGETSLAIHFWDHRITTHKMISDIPMLDTSDDLQLN